MSIFDWSKAPTDAIGAFFNAKDASFFVSTKQPSRYGGTEGFAGDKCNGEQYHVFPEYWSWEERPAQWDGQGLPLVGTVCEVKDPNGEDWYECTVIAHDSEVAVFKTVSEYPYIYDGLLEDFFRPIRTAEQIAAEERELAIKEMRNSLEFPGGVNVHYVCATLYDLGYRKQVAP